MARCVVDPLPVREHVLPSCSPSLEGEALLGGVLVLRGDQTPVPAGAASDDRLHEFSDAGQHAAGGLGDTGQLLIWQAGVFEGVEHAGEGPCGFAGSCAVVLGQLDENQVSKVGGVLAEDRMLSVDEDVHGRAAAGGYVDRGPFAVLAGDRHAVDQPAGDVQRCTHPFKAVAAVHVGHPAASGAPLGSLLILGGWGGHRWWARRCVRVRIGRGIRQQPLLGQDVGVGFLRGWSGRGWVVVQFDGGVPHVVGLEVGVALAELLGPLAGLVVDGAVAVAGGQVLLAGVVASVAADESSQGRGVRGVTELACCLG